MPLHGKTILITGGTGSFGQAFTRFVLDHYKPQALRIYSRGELLQYQMAQKYTGEKKAALRFLIGDVRDKERLMRSMSGVDIVIHAAALKHILIAEYNPMEAVKTNILGTMNVIDAAIDSNVKNVVLITTDKAVNPVNLYGATKLSAEKLFVQANSYTGDRATCFSCVRYGNVIGSRGSVVPLFLEQKKTNTLTITDMEMTRFWVTLEEVVKFVIKALGVMEGGEIFVPKIPSIKITDLARAIAPKAKLKIIGVRPGEKLHEVLLSREEVRHTKEFKDYFVIEPLHAFWETRTKKGGSSLPDNFEYASNTNDTWLTIPKVKQLLKRLNLVV